MKQTIKKTLNHPLISGSVIIFSGSLLANIFNFLFNLFMAANLTIADYGTLASLISLLTLPAYAASAIVPAIVQFGGKFFAENDLASVRVLYWKAGKFITGIGLLIFLIFIFNLNSIGSFFRISDKYLLIVTDLIIILSFFMSLNFAMLQARLSFNLIAVVTLISSLSKLVFGAFFVVIGLRTRGAISSVLLSIAIPVLVTLKPLSFVFKRTLVNKDVRTKEILGYGIPSALGLFALTSFITTDILLVKHYFDAQTAGLYAGLSLIGRVIYYFTAPIATVMFPLIVRKKNRAENYSGTFFLALAIVLAASLTITAFYYLFPNLVILLFINKKEYLGIAMLLAVFALNISVYSLVTIIVNFYLSIRNTLVFIPVFLAAAVQVLLIVLYHDSLSDIINITLRILFLLLVILLLYYPYATKKK